MPYPCPHCKMEYKTEKELGRHLAWHEERLKRHTLTQSDRAFLKAIRIAPWPEEVE